MMVPLTVLSFNEGEIVRPVEVGNEDDSDPTTAFERNLIFFKGVGHCLSLFSFNAFTPFYGNDVEFRCSLVGY